MSKDNKKKEKNISLKYLATTEGAISNKGKRKNILHLWSSKQYNVEAFENIEIPKSLINDISKDSLFVDELDELKELLKKEKNLKEYLDGYKAKDIVDLELLLYMAYKCHREFDFLLDNILLILSAIKKAMPSDWNLEIVDKINVLFKEKISKTLLVDLIEKYRSLPESIRLFKLEEEVITDTITASEEIELREYKDKYLKIREEKAKKILSDSPSNLDIDRLENQEKFIKNKIEELSVAKEKIKIKVSINNYTRNRDSKISVFERIINSNHPYMYSTILIPFPNEEQCKKNVLYMEKRDDTEDSRNIYIKEELHNIFSEKTQRAKHTFEITNYIEKRKVEKKRRNLKNYTFNLGEAARELDKLNGTKDWVDRVSTIEFKNVIWGEMGPKIYLNPTATMTLEDAVHIVGMLGAGKSTFSHLLNFVANSYGLKTVIITKDRVSSLEEYKDIVCINRELIKKGKGKVAIFSGYSRRSDSINHLVKSAKSILNKEKSIRKGIENNIDILEILDCSSIIGAKYRLAFNKEYPDQLETIDCLENSLEIKKLESKGAIEQHKMNKKKVFKVANIEYKESGIYRSLFKLVEADTWIGNVHAFLQTKCPYQLDMFCRDFLTIANLVADIVIIDEIDEILSIADNIYNVDYGIASNFIKESQSMVMDTLYREIIGVDRANYTREIDEYHRNLILEQQGVCDSIMSYFSKHEYKAKSYKHFSYYSLKFGFIKKYFEIDYPTGSDIKDFSTLIENRSFYKFQGSGNSMEKCLYWLTASVLRKKDAAIHLNGSKNKYKIKSDIEKKQKILNIDFFNDKADMQLAFKRWKMYEAIMLIGESLNWIVRTENIIKFSEESMSRRLNFSFIDDFEFLILISNLDFNQGRIDKDTTAFAKRVKMNFSINSFRKINMLPTHPDPLVKRNYNYNFRTSISDNSPNILNIKNYISIGREILLGHRNTIESLEGVSAPIYVVMSASSYMKTSSRYHVNIKPAYIIKNSKQDNTKINIKTKFVNNNSKLITISGSSEISEKSNKLRDMFLGLIKEGFFKKEFEYLKNKYEDSILNKDKNAHFTQRQIIGIAMPSYELAEIVARCLIEAQSEYKVKCLYSPNKLIMEMPIEQKEYHITMEDVRKICNEECDIFVFVMPAIGRGYNILQKNSEKSLIGTMIFPIRPFLHPEDEMYMIYALHNKLETMIEESKNYCLNKHGRLDGCLIFENLKKQSLILYNELFNGANFWKVMSPELKYWMVSNFLISILQTIGRGLRGGTDLRVYMLDAAFVSEKTRKIIEESEASRIMKIEEDVESSFLSVCKDILSNGDEVFNMVNKALIEGFRNIDMED